MWRLRTVNACDIWTVTNSVVCHTTKETIFWAEITRTCLKSTEITKIVVLSTSLFHEITTIVVLSTFLFYFSHVRVIRAQNIGKETIFWAEITRTWLKSLKLNYCQLLSIRSPAPSTHTHTHTHSVGAGRSLSRTSVAKSEVVFQPHKCSRLVRRVCMRAHVCDSRTRVEMGACMHWSTYMHW